MGLKNKLLITCHSQIFGNFKVLILRKKTMEVSDEWWKLVLETPSTIVFPKKKQKNIKA